MEIRNRLFPYPVLCDENDDYEGVMFNADMTTEVLANEIQFTVTFDVQDAAILREIRMGRAEYVIHIECKGTSYRKIVTSDAPALTYAISKSKVSGNVEILALVTAKMNIPGFTSDNLNEDYDDMDINLKKGYILAYKNLAKIFVEKDYEELVGNQSLFSVVKSLKDYDDVQPIQINLNNPRIQIIVDKGTYAAYIHYQQKNAIAMSMFVLPAVMYMIDELRANGGNAYEECLWYVKISEYYAAQDKDFIHDIIGGENNALEIAQEMLKSPIGKAYQNLMEIEE